MELKTTEEFVREAHSAACSTWKQRIEKEFPELFNTKLIVGKWYKSNDRPKHIFFVTEIKNNRYYYYGFDVDEKYNNNDWYSFYDIGLQKGFELASHEEVESAIKKEIINRFGENWKNVNIEECLWHGKLSTNCGLHAPAVLTSDNLAWNRNGCILKDGIFAEPLIEKTIITKEKALKILAKKLKVSPESIEIK